MRDLKEKRYLSVSFVVTAFTLLCLISIASKFSIWFDESFTVNLIRKPFSEVIRLTALDVHPPLYYLAVKSCTILFGESVFSLYLTSVLCYGVFLAATALFFHRFFSGEISFFVTVAFCCVPNMLRYAVQLRMYSMAMLFVTLSFYLTYIIWNDLGGGKPSLFRKAVFASGLIGADECACRLHALFCRSGSGRHFLFPALYFSASKNRKA